MSVVIDGIAFQDFSKATPKQDDYFVGYTDNGGGSASYKAYPATFIIGDRTAGTLTPLSGAGVGATTSLGALSDDVSGVITVTGGTGSTGGAIAQYNFHTTKVNKPVVMLTPVNGAAIALCATAGVGNTNASGSAFTVDLGTGGTLVNTTPYIFNYHVITKD